MILKKVLLITLHVINNLLPRRFSSSIKIGSIKYSFATRLVHTAVHSQLMKSDLVKMKVGMKKILLIRQAIKDLTLK